MKTVYIVVDNSTLSESRYLGKGSFTFRPFARRFLSLDDAVRVAGVTSAHTGRQFSVEQIEVPAGAAVMPKFLFPTSTIN